MVFNFGKLFLCLLPFISLHPCQYTEAASGGRRATFLTAAKEERRF